MPTPAAWWRTIPAASSAATPGPASPPSSSAPPPAWTPTPAGWSGYQDTGGSVVASFTTGTVTADSRSATGAEANAGGLIGYQNAGSVTAGYSHAHPEAKTSATANTATLNAGGLLGELKAGAVTASFATGKPDTSGREQPHGAQGRPGRAQTRRGHGHQLLLGHDDVGHHGHREQARARPPANSRRPRPTARSSSIYGQLEPEPGQRRQRQQRDHGQR